MNKNIKSKNKNLLIIGGSSSLGKEIIKKFTANDWYIISTYYSNKLPTQKNLIIKKLNLLSKISINSFVEYLKNISKIDCVLFLSSILNGKQMQDYTFNEINECMNINFTGQAYLLGKILNNLSEKCSILFISSISGQKGSYDSIYAASKGAQISFVKSISKSLAPKLRVNVLSPSLIKNSKMYFDMKKSIRDRHLKTNPMKSLVNKSDIAEIVYDISSSSWQHLNGQVISINGGLYS